jgi:hypothetical protein
MWKVVLTMKNFFVRADFKTKINEKVCSSQVQIREPVPSGGTQCSPLPATSTLV